MGNESHAQHFVRDSGRFGGVLRHFYAAALPPSPSVYLRLPPPAAADLLGRRFGLFYRERHFAARHRDVVLGQEGLGLILMNFHGILLVLVWQNSQTFQYIMSLLPYLERVVERGNLSSEEALAAMETILSGAASHPQIAAFPFALRM